MTPTLPDALSSLSQKSRKVMQPSAPASSSWDGRSTARHSQFNCHCTARSACAPSFNIVHPQASHHTAPMAATPGRIAKHDISLAQFSALVQHSATPALQQRPSLPHFTAIKTSPDQLASYGTTVDDTSGLNHVTRAASYTLHRCHQCLYPRHGRVLAPNNTDPRHATLCMAFTLPEQYTEHPGLKC